MAIRSLEQLPLDAKRVFVRVDFNVPLKGGTIQDDTRIRAALPTLETVLEAGGSLVLASHLGRPKGGPDPAFSLAPVARRLEELLGRPITLAPAVVGAEVERLAAATKPGEVLLLENVRFHPGETKNDPELSRRSGCAGGALRERRLRQLPPCPRLHRRHGRALRGRTEGCGQVAARGDRGVRESAARTRRAPSWRSSAGPR